jgi:nucleoside-diphosphate-sugar epimerase
MQYGPQHVTTSLRSDLAEIADVSQAELEVLVNNDVVITGATGFVGTWLVLSWVYARKQLNGTGRLIVTSRSPDQIRPLIEEIDKESSVTYIASDITDLQLPSTFGNSFVVHAATPASALLNSTNPSRMLDIIISGQRQVISECIRTKSRLLFLSSGAVYGRQPVDLECIPEKWEGAPNINTSESAYHEGKRVAELMANIAYQHEGLDYVTARLFAFLAPFLPFDAHFAAGNFIRDSLGASPIIINSGGGSVRSYQYGTDLVSSLWKLLIDGHSGNAYNVGSDEAVTIKDLAARITGVLNSSTEVCVLGTDTPENVSRYVPSLRKINGELGAHNKVGLDEAIRRTSMWATQSFQGELHEH